MLLHYLVAYYEVQAVFWWPPQLRQLKQEPIPRAVVVAQAVAYLGSRGPRFESRWELNFSLSSLSYFSISGAS